MPYTIFDKYIPCYKFKVRCPDGWFPWDNSCYRHEPDIQVDRDAGQDFCQNTYNANLFVPNSKDEADVMKAYLAGVKVNLPMLLI